MRKPTSKITQAIAAAAVLAVATLATIAVPAAPAAADGVYGWGDGGIYIYVETGAKDHANNRQWVSSISIIDAQGRCDWGTTEAWISRPGAIDWYRNTQMCGSKTFWISRWVPSGSQVCGSTWFRARAWNGNTYWYRSIACISIRV